MSCIVKSFDKKTGITYLYSSESRWDPVRKRPSPVRKCIGKLDPVTGKMVPTGKRGRPKKATVATFASDEPPVLSEDVVTLQRQLSETREELSEAREQLQQALVKISDLQETINEKDAEIRHLNRRIDSFLTSLDSLEKAFASHRSVAKGF